MRLRLSACQRERAITSFFPEVVTSLSANMMVVEVQALVAVIGISEMPLIR